MALEQIRRKGNRDKKHIMQKQKRRKSLSLCPCRCHRECDLALEQIDRKGNRDKEHIMQKQKRRKSLTLPMSFRRTSRRPPLVVCFIRRSSPVPKSPQDFSANLKRYSFARKWHTTCGWLGWHDRNSLGCKGMTFDNQWCS